MTVTAVFAHPGADERFAARTADRGSCAPEPWLERARALADEGRIGEALAAVDEAGACDASPVDVALTRGILLVDRDPRAALAELEVALAARPDHAGARVARSRALEALGRDVEAAVELAAAVAGSREPSPDDVVRLAKLRVRLGDPEGALAALDAAPPSPASVREAVLLEIALGRSESALGRLDAMPDTPFWWALRAELVPR